MQEIALADQLKKNASATWVLYNQSLNIPLNTFTYYYRLKKRKYTDEVINEIFLSLLKYKPKKPWSYGEIVGRNVTTVKEVNEIIAQHEESKKSEATDARSMFERMETFFNAQHIENNRY